MISSEKQELIKKLASLTLEERKETNITREHLDILVDLYHSNDQIIIPLLSENNKLDLSYFSITDQDLRGFNFANFILKHCNFRKSRFDGESLKTILSKANTDKISIKGMDLRNSDFSSQIIYDRAVGVTLDIPFNFEGLKLDKSNFAGSDLRNANFDNTSLQGVIFANANLTGASFVNSDIQGANFEDAIFYPEQLAQAINFQQAIFSENSMIESITKELNTLQNPQHPLIKKLKHFVLSLKLHFKAKVTAKIFSNSKIKLKNYDNSLLEHNEHLSQKSQDNSPNFTEKLSHEKDKHKNELIGK